MAAKSSEPNRPGSGIRLAPSGVEGDPASVLGVGSWKLEVDRPRIRNFRYSDFFIRPSSHTTIDATVSLPWIVEMSKHSMRRGTDGRPRTDRSVSSASKWAAVFSLNRVRYESSAFLVASST